MTDSLIQPSKDFAVARSAPDAAYQATIAAMNETQAVGLVQSHVRDGDLDAAADVATAWLERNSGFWMLRERYDIIFARGAHDEALSGLSDLWQRYPEIAAAHSTYIARLGDAGRRGEASAVLAVAEVKFPDDVWILHHAANEAERAGDLAKAFGMHRRALEIQPDMMLARIGMARVLAAGGKTQGLIDMIAGEDVAFGEEPVKSLDYLTPSDLRMTPTKLRRGLVIGSCLTAGMPEIFAANAPFCEADYVLTNNGMGLPTNPVRPMSDYDFQFIQLPLRFLLSERSYMRLRHDQPEAFQNLFDDVCASISSQLADLMVWGQSHGTLTFVSNFFTPQQNPMGRLLPRYDLRNLVFFVEKMNEHLAAEIATYSNTYLLDIDKLSASIGRRNLQDDAVWTINHGAALAETDYAGDQQRLEAIEPIGVYYPHDSHEFSVMVWREIEAMYRSIHQIDMVKMVLVDLDDTMWRGVLADNGSTDLEGWPIAFAEALLFLKQRGVILGIVSKNTEDRIRELWPYHDLLTLDDFAIHRINWVPKAENIAEILSEVNLLPGSVVFVDDNPVERAAVNRAFPEMRTFGSNPYLWRRILLWSAEIQTATITAESANRSEMIQAQSKRESQRKRQSRPEFLQSLNIRVSMKTISGVDDPSFPRASELINKTNQFNSTGKRWSQAEGEAWFAAGGVFYAMTVVDDFTPYGLVGVLCVKDGRIHQFVMSCRVIGLDVELAAVSQVLAGIRDAGCDRAYASAVVTPANLLSRDIWARTGFAEDGGDWSLPLTEIPAVPPHIRMV